KNDVISDGSFLVLDQLLSTSEPWLQYTIRLNILNENKDDLLVLKNEALKDKKILSYLNDITNFHNTIVRNHKDPELSIHKLLFLLDIGFETDIPQIKSAVNQIINHKDTNGVYQSMTNIPPHYGGKGEDVFGWCLCDAPLLLMALLKAKIDYQQHIKQGVEHLTGLYKEQGFPCSVSKEHGSFRGPGRKDDCCPYATLIMLKLLSEIEEYQHSDIVKNIAEVILSLWENSLKRHPYMFYMGTDFRKLKAPAMWYDIVSVLDVLSRFDFVKTDWRFCEMIDLIQQKQNADGMFVPESVYQKFKGWDFGQKKTVSPYLTYLCIRLLKRVNG
ncbi:hypothetical protein LJC42_04165, partial [Eubacteriales bacterium OttesenSCG-928-K08]|nr:hypothetical protein [Eubacteriales bacterium OttesenSCG-928-K08]